MLGKNVLVSQFEVADGASKGLTQKDEEELIWPRSTVGGADTGERGRPSRGQMTLRVAPPLVFSEVSGPMNCLVGTQRNTNSTCSCRSPESDRPWLRLRQAG